MNDLFFLKKVLLSCMKAKTSDQNMDIFTEQVKKILRWSFCHDLLNPAQKSFFGWSLFSGFCCTMAIGEKKTLFFFLIFEILALLIGLLPARRMTVRMAKFCGIGLAIANLTVSLLLLILRQDTKILKNCFNVWTF